jgi:hypothetical protein
VRFSSRLARRFLAAAAFRFRVRLLGLGNWTRVAGREVERPRAAQ